jgi:hypothetical protein
MTDLVLRGGRVLDPAGGRDETVDVAFGGGKVTGSAMTSTLTRPTPSMCVGCSSFLA